MEEIAQERGLEGIDWAGFEQEMDAQRERAGASAERFGGEFGAVRVYQELGVEETRFLGYETIETRSVIVGMVVDGIPAERAGRGPAGRGSVERDAILRRAGRAGRGYGNDHGGRFRYGR